MSRDVISWIYVALCTVGCVGLYFLVYFLILKRKKRKELAIQEIPIEENNEPDEENSSIVIEMSDGNDEQTNDWKNLIKITEGEEEEYENPLDQIGEQLIEKINNVKFTVDLNDLNNIARMTNNKKITKEDFIRMLQKGERFK